MGISLIRNTPLLPIAICLILGIMAGFSLPLQHFPLFLWPILLFILLFFTIVADKCPRIQTALLYAITVATGCFHAIYYQHKNHSDALFPNTAVISGIIASEKSEKPKTYAFNIILTENGQEIKCHIAKDERSAKLQPGDGLQMELEEFSGLLYVGVHHWQRAKVSSDTLSAFTRARLISLRIRHRLLERYRLLGAANDQYAVLAAMTLGDKSALSKDIRNTYSVTGASHILALSGMHLGILYMLLSMLTLSRRKRHSIWSQSLLVVAIWAFAMLTGLSTSIVRAALMISLFAIFSVGFRTQASLNLLCLSAIIILGINPIALYDIGFQLSYMAVLSILVIAPLLKGKKEIIVERTGWGFKERLFRKSKETLGALFRVSIAAQIGIAPLIAFYFGRFSTYFLLTNLIVLPAAYIILYGSLFMLIVPWQPLSSAVMGTVSLLNHILTKMNRWPMASIEGLHPSVPQVISYYFIIACIIGIIIVWNRKRSQYAAIRWDDSSSVPAT